MKRIFGTFLLAIASITLTSSPSNSQECYGRIYGSDGRPIDIGSLCGGGQNSGNFYQNNPDRSSGVFRARIIRRLSGVPVVAVKFNGQQSYPMLLDTGASYTVITPQMARALGVKEQGSIPVSTASESVVHFGTGYVGSVEVGGFMSRNLYVAIASDQLAIGLLGQNFFGNYDVTIRKDYVEFHPR